MIQSILEEDDDHSQSRSITRAKGKRDVSDERKQDFSGNRGKDQTSFVKYGGVDDNSGFTSKFDDSNAQKERRSRKLNQNEYGIN